jgi:hypothetical protein
MRETIECTNSDIIYLIKELLLALRERTAIGIARPQSTRARMGAKPPLTIRGIQSAQAILGSLKALGEREDRVAVVASIYFNELCCIGIADIALRSRPLHVSQQCPTVSRSSISSRLCFNSARRHSAGKPPSPPQDQWGSRSTVPQTPPVGAG